MDIKFFGPDSQFLNEAFRTDGGDPIDDVSLNSTRYRAINRLTDYEITVRGTGFSRDGAGDPSFGRVTSVSFSRDGTTVATISDVNWNGTDFGQAFFVTLAEDGRVDGVSELFSQQPITIDATESDTAFVMAGGIYARLFGSVTSEVTARGSVAPDYLLGGQADDSLYGGGSNDLIYGDFGNDLIAGNAGSDTLEGYDGADAIYGGDGNDVISGGDGNDTLGGAAGNDDLTGGLGNDRLWGSFDNDTMSGGDGDDTLGGFRGDDILSGGSGRDELWGSFGNDMLMGGAGNDTLGGFRGNDTANGGGGNDELWGSTGSDVLSGGTGNDQIGGGTENDLLYGGSGSDQLSGGLGDDKIFGGTGNDTVFGSDGDDTIEGGVGDDMLYGGAGSDTFVFRVSQSGDDDVFTFSRAGGDRLSLDTDLWDDRDLNEQQVVDEFASVNGAGNVVFDFGDVSFELVNVTNVTGLDNFIDSF